MADMNKDAPAYAHTPPAGSKGWHTLQDHLIRTARLARYFARPFGGGDIAYWAGLWHDIGKFNPEFQNYLQARWRGRWHARAPHAHLGAALVFSVLNGRLGWEDVALPIAGHHSGLHHPAILSQELIRLRKERGGLLDLIGARVIREKLIPPQITIPAMPGTRRELFIRMVMSAVVDADHLDTERHFDSVRQTVRGRWPSIETLRQRFQTSSVKSLPDTGPKVNEVREEVLAACVDAASKPESTFRLTAPTGAGKTRSALAFALERAHHRGLRRVIVALPYTSIIDQTAAEYEKWLGKDAVLEHHSQFEPAEGEDQAEEALRLNCATENWDAPLIVTTTVQLFESLLSNRPAHVRKLHNIARSVIILDEVQTLPPEVLKPTLDVLRALVGQYKVSLVFSTATQPAFQGVEGFEDWHIPEMVPQYRRHFADLTRVNYAVKPGQVTWRELASELRGHPQFMVVLNARRDAITLLAHMNLDAGTYHLSGLMCGAHRRTKLEEIRQRLPRGDSVRLVSTQVVEAGVDIDFPVVYRAFGPLDRIVQAAGRCNRNGKPEKGLVIVFNAAEAAVPRGPYKVGLEKALLLLRDASPEQLHDPAFHEEYFRRFYADIDLDRNGIQELRNDLDYPQTAQMYRLIPEDTVPVIVPYGPAEERLDEWRREPNRRSWQRLQPYIVSLHEREATRLNDWLEPLSGRMFAWRGDPKDYDDSLGLKVVLRDPSDLMDAEYLSSR